jgi:hypothetical protein
MGFAAQTKMDEVAHRYDAYEGILDRGLVPRGDNSFRHECDIIERAVAGKDLRYVAVGLGYSPKRRRQNRFDLFVLLDEVIVTRNKRSHADTVLGGR